MQEIKEDSRATWDSLWFSKMGVRPGGFRPNLHNRFIFSTLSQIVQLEGLNVVELGAGSGILSYLIRSIGKANSVTMIDRSAKAIEYSKSLFDSLEGAQWREQDLFEARGHYDLAVSVGLLEHFKGEEQVRVVEVHASLAPRVAIVVPACSIWNARRMQAKKTLQKYGWQMPLSTDHLQDLFNKCGLSVVHNARFMPSYGMPFTNRRIIGKALSSLSNAFLPALSGGLVLCYGMNPDLCKG